MLCSTTIAAQRLYDAIYFTFRNLEDDSLAQRLHDASRNSGISEHGESFRSEKWVLLTVSLDVQGKSSYDVSPGQFVAVLTQLQVDVKNGVSLASLCHRVVDHWELWSQA